MMAGLLADVNSYSLKVAVFRGTDKTDLIKRNEYGYKCMLVAVKQVLDYMEALNDTAVDMGGSLRKESRMFDFSCFREAWLNACLHNRWSRQTPPAVYMFDDRIEIISVGGLPDGLALEEFFEGKSKPVNLELQQIMGQLDYIEQTGHGVPLIVSRYGKEVFDITEKFITVTIPLNKKDLYSRKKEGVRLDDSDEKILMLMQENCDIRVSEISRQIGLGLTTITKRIHRLKEEGILDRKGSKKKGQWIVNDIWQKK
ncbi:MAG: AsnC family transcriptional regulator [Lachnospiraceae bacterium]|nr:AsnC family transcriptional regulator [Lachnospiraceae bacterium]MCI8873280.1 AsnC family transcriptional regulator [Lachnospiraceae bacterium]